jgi:hypothetical protein
LVLAVTVRDAPDEDSGKNQRPIDADGADDVV